LAPCLTPNSPAKLCVTLLPQPQLSLLTVEKEYSMLIPAPTGPAASSVAIPGTVSVTQGHGGCPPLARLRARAGEAPFSAPGRWLPVVRKTCTTAVNRIRPFALGSRLLVWLAVPNHKRSLSFRGQLTASGHQETLEILLQSRRWPRANRNWSFGWRANSLACPTAKLRKAVTGGRMASVGSRPGAATRDFSPLRSLP
jgi:hypothetical protein